VTLITFSLSLSVILTTTKKLLKNKYMKFRKIVITVLLLIGLTIAPVLPALAEKPGDVRLLLSFNRCSYCDLSGIELSNIRLVNANLNNVDFSRTFLTQANLTKANLSSSDLSHANFKGIVLQGANLSNSNLSGINLSNANLNESNLTNANLVNANLSGASLTNAKFSGWGGSAKLSLANLSHANLQGSNLRNASLVDVDFSDADLSNHVDLQGAILNGANLSGANLLGANLSEAHLSYVNLQGANLNGANLSKAVLSGADLRGADLTNIDFNEAIFNKTLGLDPYAQQLFQQAVDKGNAGYYLTALNLLNKIPDETEVYSSAQNKKTEYTELQNQKELAAKEMFQEAENAAKSRNYQEALNNLRAVPSETEVYSKAQSKIKEYKKDSTGIGLSSFEIQSFFENPVKIEDKELKKDFTLNKDFAFKNSSLVDGQLGSLGTSHDKQILVEIIGSVFDVNSVTIMSFIADEKFDMIENVFYMVTFLEKFSSKWGIPSNWFSKNVDMLKPGKKLEKVSIYGNIEITFKFLPQLESLLLKIKAIPAT
jgi:uncharacterized protein YjbI with pentapeptide repeats